MKFLALGQDSMIKILSWHVKMQFYLTALSDLPRFLSPEPGRGVIRAYVALQHSTVTWYTTSALYTHLHCRA